MIANTLQLQQSKILCKFNYCHDFINKYVLLFGININKLIALLHRRKTISCRIAGYTCYFQIQLIVLKRMAGSCHKCCTDWNVKRI